MRGMQLRTSWWVNELVEPFFETKIELCGSGRLILENWTDVQLYTLFFTLLQFDNFANDADG